MNKDAVIDKLEERIGVLENRLNEMKANTDATAVDAANGQAARTVY